MKVIDIVAKDMKRFFRSGMGLVFMFGVPLLVTGMFYFMFGNIAQQDDFSLPSTKVVIANMDRGGPKFEVSTRNIPGSLSADTMGELVVGLLSSEEMADLLEVSEAASPEQARAAVDSQQAQVAIIIPEDFSQQFADVYGTASIQFYQDPTLTIGPSIVKSILSQFMDGMAGVKIAVNVAIGDGETANFARVGPVVQEYLNTSLVQDDDPEAALLEVRLPRGSRVDPEEESRNVLLGIVGPIMGGMMIFYAFYTGTAIGESILREEEERTLPRLFTTPTLQAAILGGKFLGVFLTVLAQVVVLILASAAIFGIRWGETLSIVLAAAGIVCAASAFGIFINSMLKSTRQGGIVFGGILTVTGMIGMIGIFAMGSPTGQMLSNSVSLLVPQGWAVRGLLQSMNQQPIGEIALTLAVLMAWSAVFFLLGVWRFNKRYQ
jgi:ABC-2 type transport system permease protein